MTLPLSRFSCFSSWLKRTLTLTLHSVYLSGMQIVLSACIIHVNHALPVTWTAHTHLLRFFHSPSLIGPAVDRIHPPVSARTPAACTLCTAFCSACPTWPAWIPHLLLWLLHFGLTHFQICFPGFKSALLALTFAYFFFTSKREMWTWTPNLLVSESCI